MELMPGYKISEAGVIPEDWESRPLSSIGRFKNGINKGSEAFGHGTPFVNLMDVFGVNSIKSCDGLGLVKTSDAEQETYDLKLGDVIFIRSSVKPSGVGLTAVVEADLPKTVYSGFLIRFRDDNALDIAFKKHCFYSEKFRSDLIAASTVSANTNINQDNLKKLFIALPPTTAEQRAIAQALSDVDALLATLDQVIAKKRDLKQAAMQKLLTGETRLPGYSGEWETLPAREIGFFKGGSGFPLGAQGEPNGEYPFFKVSDMNNEGNETFMTVANHYISEQTRTRLGATAFPPDSIVFAKVGAAVFLERKRILGQASCIDNNMAAFVLDKNRVDVGYVHALLLNKKLSALVTTTALPALSAKQLGEMQLAVPPLPEQSAIATVLSDMDAELSVLEARRDKTRNIKQAMMQELLTGKTRLA